MPTPIASYASALAAYARAGGASPPEAEAPQPAAAGSFGAALQGVLEQGIAASKAGEKAAEAGIAGKTDLAGVVSAVAEAEVMLQSVVAIRDRAVEAYKDIMRMPI